MHLLTRFSLKNRALIALVTIVAAVFGVIGVGSLKQELMPSVQFPTIAVITSYPGASPEVVNGDVSGPIETALRGVPQLESTTATSSTGVSTVLAQFTYGVDLAVTEQKVERAISRIQSVLPKAADAQVMSGSIDDFPVVQISVTPADGQTTEQVAQLVSQAVVPKLADVDGVRDAQLSGDRPERVMIRPNSDKLADAGLTDQSITDALQQSGVLVAAGTVADGDRTLAVQAGQAVTTPADIAAIPIPGSGEAPAVEQQPQIPEAREGESAEGGSDANAAADPREQLALQQPAQPIELPAARTIGDFAKVELEQAPVTSISRVDGKDALTIAVTKTSAANTVDVSHAVQAELDKLESQVDGAKMTVVFDQAPYIEKSIKTLTTEGMLGLLFAVLVILVFLMSVRATLVTAISIPTSVLLTFVGLNFADYTLNMLTLGALTISIGRVVDDSIVVVENIKRHLRDEAHSDDSRVATIVEAVREVAGAITASTVTTVAVFLPMAFVSGMVGEMFRPFAFTVTIALAASLLVSLTIVPVLSYWFLGARGARSGTKREAKNEASQAEPKRMNFVRRAQAAEAAGTPTAMQRGYKPIIEWTLTRPAITIVIAVAVLGATLAATPLMKTNFMSGTGQNSIGLAQQLEPGTSIEAQLEQGQRVEEALNGVDAVESVQLTISGGASGMQAMMGGGGDGAVSYSITTDEHADQEAVQDEIRAAVEQLDDAGEFSITQSEGGMMGSSSIDVTVSAPNQQTLTEASEIVRGALAESSELKQVESDLGQSRPYLSVTIDRAAAAKVGLTEAAVAGQLSQLMQPQQIGQITSDATTTAVYLNPGKIPADVKGVKALKLQTAAGEKRLDKLATVEVADGPVAIHTQDGGRTVTVSALPKTDDLSTAGVAVTTALDGLELPAGANAEVGGVMAQQSEAFGQLGIALLAAILIVYVVMVATFKSLLQPLLLLASVPFAATGALLLLLATGIPLGVPSLIGVLMLVGIVVTNAIVLIDLVNQYRERGDELREAVLHGTMQRLRPIVMTALATILALTPMGLGVTGEGGFISQPLAVVVIGGLLSSTVLTLVVLPTLYYIVERGRENRKRRRGGFDPRPGGGLPGLGGAALAGASLDAGAVRESTAPGSAGVVSAGSGAAGDRDSGALGATGAGASGVGVASAAGLAAVAATGKPAKRRSLRRRDRREAALAAGTVAPGADAGADVRSTMADADFSHAKVAAEPVSEAVEVDVDTAAGLEPGASQGASHTRAAAASVAPFAAADVYTDAPASIDAGITDVAEPVHPSPTADAESVIDFGLIGGDDIDPVLADALRAAAEADAAAAEALAAEVFPARPAATLGTAEQGATNGSLFEELFGDVAESSGSAEQRADEAAGQAAPEHVTEQVPEGLSHEMLKPVRVRRKKKTGPVNVGFASDEWGVADEPVAPLVLPEPNVAGDSEAAGDEDSGEPADAGAIATAAAQVADSDDAHTTQPRMRFTPETRGAGQAAPPVTGELNWEQLMWEATQDVDAHATEADAAHGEASGTAAPADSGEGAAADADPAQEPKDIFGNPLRLHSSGDTPNEEQ